MVKCIKFVPIVEKSLGKSKCILTFNIEDVKLPLRRSSYTFEENICSLNVDIDKLNERQIIIEGTGNVCEIQMCGGIWNLYDRDHMIFLFEKFMEVNFIIYYITKYVRYQLVDTNNGDYLIDDFVQEIILRILPRCVIRKVDDQGIESKIIKYSDSYDTNSSVYNTLLLLDKLYIDAYF